MGNMDSIIFLGGREASTLKDISENWLGKATISMQTEGRSRRQSESYSQNMQRLGRELMTTSEITTMLGDKYTVYEVGETDTDEEADLLNFDDLDSDEFVSLRATLPRSDAAILGRFL